MKKIWRVLPAALGFVLLSCADVGPVAPATGVGPSPELPEPRRSLLPTVNIAPASSWPAGTKPVAAAGLQVTAFATGLDHPRWIHVLPNGDVLVAESNAPKRVDDNKGFKAWAMGLVKKRAGAGTPSANRITLLRDVDGDGVAEVRSVLLEGLNSPFGMALVGQMLYVANTDAVVKFPYAEGALRITAPPVQVTSLPAGTINHHWTKNLIANRTGDKLYATVGSNSNVAENGLAAEEGRAAIWEIDAATGAKRLFATGLRNPNGLAWEPRSGALWTVVNERDELGDDLVPDYLTSVRDAGFYGWPYSYFGNRLDPRIDPPRPDLAATAIVPDYALGNHVAPLGLAFAEGARLPAPFTEGAFVGLHGSWNRRPRSGYSVVFVAFRDGKPLPNPPLDVLTGFVDAGGQARGRPVGVALDKRGGLLVADDVGNVLWRVAAQ